MLLTTTNLEETGEGSHDVPAVGLLTSGCVTESALEGPAEQYQCFMAL